MLAQAALRGAPALSPVVALVSNGAVTAPATFTRASPATLLSGGTLTEYAVNTPRITADGTLTLEAERVNKCKNYNLDPTDSTGLSGATAIVSIADDSVALAAAGFSSARGIAFKADNSAGNSFAFINISGYTENTNEHTTSVIARTMNGGGRVGATNAATYGQLGFDEDTQYKRYALVYTPSAATSRMWVRVDAGAIAYFIGNQLEEGSAATSLIAVPGDTATRAADLLTWTPPVAQTLYLVGTATDGTVYTETAPLTQSAPAGETWTAPTGHWSAIWGVTT